MKNIFLVLIEIAFFILAAPILSGFITKVKNTLRMRIGQGVLQPYFNLVKLFSKDEVISKDASWVFRIAPYMVFSSVLTAAVLIPIFIFTNPLNHMGDFIALIFIFSLGRFFLCLAALDTGSSFGGMGSSREMFISSLAEPVMCLVVFSVALQFGSTNLAAFSGMHGISVASIVGAIALFLITIAETSRVPVDNQETHLELTMVHEAMVLEYSGRSLALLEISSYIKQLILFFIIAQIIFPINVPEILNSADFIYWILWYVARFAIIAIIVALVEVSLAKMRLFRVADFLGFAFVLGIVAVIFAILGA